MTNTIPCRQRNRPRVATVFKAALGSRLMIAHSKSRPTMTAIVTPAATPR
jgi:hypothetical protein